MPLAEKNEIMRMVESDSLHELFEASRQFGEYQKTQKYLYLALTKSLFQGERDICSGCRKCLTVCPTKSFNLFKEKNGELVIGINRKTCEYCWACMKSCPIVSP
jgi:formate hydrogenlyase subunit 6/NADH:ubiquinone oxidoreductase subunit I